MKYMKSNRRLSIVFVIAILVGMCFASVTATDPTIGTVTITPTEPAPQSNINFSVTIIGEGITSVYLHYKECNAQICKVFKNISMEKVSGNLYEETITLTWDQATFITYNFEINSNGTWTPTKYVNVTLKKPTNGNGNNTNGNDHKQPGFEILFFIAAIGISVMIIGRRRFR
jgi:hypothetical protein